MKIHEISHTRDTLFTVKGVDDIYWYGGAVMTEGDGPEPGFIAISTNGKHNIWYPNDIEVQRVFLTTIDKPMYHTLEEILDDMQQQKRHLTIMEKLSNTIENGRYIQEGTR